MHLLRRACSGFLLFVLSLGGSLLPARSSVAQAFSLNAVRHNLTAGGYSAHTYADFDRDGDFDLILLGANLRVPDFQPRAFAARSLGEKPAGPDDKVRRHTFALNALPTALWHGDVAPADYDGDGYVDVVMSGALKSRPPFEGASVLYHNDGTGQMEAASTELPGLYGSIASWADYDNDGDSDLLLAGAKSSQVHATYLFRNEEDGFSEVSTPFADVAYGDAAWADYDSDGDMDVLLTGAQANGPFTTRLYRNDGGSFQEVDAPLPDLAFGSVEWGDYDTDGDPDILLSGGRFSVDVLDGVSAVYANDGGSFSRAAALKGVALGTATWTDYDVDGDLDALVAGGESAFGLRVSELYRFTAPRFERSAVLPGAFSGEAEWADYDDDNDLDLLTSGLRNNSLPFVKLYRNDQPMPNTPPSAPAGLRASVSGDAATLSWEAATDAQTPDAALSYNLRLGTAPGRADVMAALAAPDSGYRYVAEPGNAGQNTRWTVRGLPPGIYYWSVQAIDNSYKGSPFAAEGRFDVQSSGKTDTEQHGSSPSRYRLHANYPNPFHTRTTIAYEVPTPSRVTLVIYNVLGEKVRTLVDGRQSAARHRVSWNGRSEGGRRLSSGVYVARMQAKGVTLTRQLTLVR